MSQQLQDTGNRCSGGQLFYERCTTGWSRIRLAFTNGLIRTVKEKMLRIDSVTIMTNDDFLRSILMNTLVEDFQENLAITSLSVDDMQPCEENELSLVFLNPYNKSLGKRIRDRHMGLTP